MRDLGFHGVVLAVGFVACDFPRPADVGPDGRATEAPSIDANGVDVAAVHLEPRYLPSVCDEMATLSVFTTNASPFDTGLDSNCTGGIVSQISGPAICVVRYQLIHIAASATLSVFGTRALALVADTSVIIDGVLDVSAKGTANGPGGGVVVSGDRSLGASGGGGAGFKTAGGSGGSDVMDGGGGLGGRAATDPSFAPVLLGGSRANNALASGAMSGGGGGAVMLIACRGDISVNGAISAGGGGGDGGATDANLQFFAGAGGGSGGYVILQGLTIAVTGSLFANGGGGGAGNATQFGVGQAGSDGTQSTTNAAQGGAAVAGAGAGGAGGIRGTTPGFGFHPSVAGVRAGGGGGSVGFLQTYTPMNVVPMLAPVATSPDFSPNKLIGTH
jgi:hypothetical protein